MAAGRPAPPSPDADPVRVGVTVRGAVQGVGFRPFAYRLAHDLDLAGTVTNDAQGVRLEVEGPPAAVAAFVARLRTDAPSRARTPRGGARSPPPSPPPPPAQR